jgi:hypothetical protein
MSAALIAGGYVRGGVGVGVGLGAAAVGVAIVAPRYHNNTGCGYYPTHPAIDVATGPACAAPLLGATTVFAEARTS